MNQTAAARENKACSGDDIRFSSIPSVPYLWFQNQSTGRRSSLPAKATLHKNFREGVGEARGTEVKLNHLAPHGELGVLIVD